MLCVIAGEYSQPNSGYFYLCLVGFDSVHKFNSDKKWCHCISTMKWPSGIWFSRSTLHEAMPLKLQVKLWFLWSINDIYLNSYSLLSIALCGNYSPQPKISVVINVSEFSKWWCHFLGTEWESSGAVTWATFHQKFARKKAFVYCTIAM